MYGHALAMGVFGYGGYLAYRWDETAAVLIEKKKAEIAERRKARLERAEATEAKLMAEQDQH